MYFVLSVDMLLAAYGLGIAFMFPGGFLVRQYGYRFSCALGAAWTVLGYAVIGLGNYTKEFYMSYPYFMHLYFFVIGNT